MSEFDLIRWIRRQNQDQGPATLLGIGDDCALLRLHAGRDLVATTDMLMDGRHFRLDRDGPEAAGFKALAVNISDIAAMAARPLAALVAVALPRQGGLAADVARGIQNGLNQAAARFGVALVGGDTNAWDGPLVISVTALGETTDRGAVRRSGAKPGDRIYVTGALGGSLLGRHLRPTPRVAEALTLNDALPIHAMIDLSDGLSSDLGHILEESGGLGAMLDASAIPIHADALALSRDDGRSPLDHVLNDGEDFELCFTIDRNDQDRLGPLGMPLFLIGEIVTMPGLWLRQPSGALQTLRPAGFDHLKG